LGPAIGGKISGTVRRPVELDGSDFQLISCFDEEAEVLTEVFDYSADILRLVKWRTGNLVCPDRQDCLSSTPNV